MIKISKESCLLKVSKFFCKGVLRFFVFSNKEAILPISVDISHILGNLITVIFDYQILRKPLKILSL